MGEAIVEGADDIGIDTVNVTDFKAIPGHGIEVTIDENRSLLGNRKLND